MNDGRKQRIIEALGQQGQLFDLESREQLIAEYPEWAGPLERWFSELDALVAAHGDHEEATVQLTRSSRATSTTSAGAGPLGIGNGHESTFGDYQLLEHLGQGGMGVVYRATQKSLDRDVAIKMIRDAALEDAEQVARFETEAKAAANLNHAGIVPVHEFGRREGRHFLVMGLVQGESLADYLKKHQVINPDQAIHWIKELADAINYAHKHGVIHRDLKPANVMMDRSGKLMITDFGLALLDSQKERYTMTGQVMGTPSYMAPEQAAGLNDAISPSTDVYALGALLYQMLVGRPPFQADSVLETLNQVLTTDPRPLREIDPSISRDLEAICLKCLNKDSGNRYESANALSADLTRLQHERPVVARPAGVVSRLRNWLSHEQRLYDIARIMLAGACFLIVAASLIYLDRWQSRDRVEQELELLEHQFNKQLISAYRNEHLRNQDRLKKFHDAYKLDKKKRGKLENTARQIKEEAESILSRSENLPGNNDYLRTPAAARKFLKEHPGVDIPGAQKRIERWTDFSRKRASVNVFFASMSLGIGLLFSMMLVTNGVALFRDPRTGTLFGTVFGSVVFLASAVLVLRFFTLYQAPQFSRLFWSPVSLLFGLTIALYLTLAIMALHAFRANREKLAYRKLGLRVHDSDATVFNGVRFGPTSWIGGILTAAILIPAYFLFMNWFRLEIRLQGDRSTAFLNGIWLGLGLMMLFAFAMEVFRMRTTVRRLAVSRFGWRLDNGIGATFEFRETPDFHMTTLIDAFLIQVTAGLLGGRVRQRFSEPPIHRVSDRQTSSAVHAQGRGCIEVSRTRGESTSRK